FLLLCVTHPASSQLYTLSLHDALPISFVGAPGMGKSTLAALLCASGADLVTDDVLRLSPDGAALRCCFGPAEIRLRSNAAERKRSEEHTSELQSRGHLVCRLLLEKKKI